MSICFRKETNLCVLSTWYLLKSGSNSMPSAVTHENMAAATTKSMEGSVIVRLLNY